MYTGGRISEEAVLKCEAEDLLLYCAHYRLISTHLGLPTDSRDVHVWAEHGANAVLQPQRECVDGMGAQASRTVLLSTHNLRAAVPACCA